MAIASVLAGLSILVVGDSHLSVPGSLVTSLHDELLRAGAKQVHSIGMCGAHPSDWLTVTTGKCGGAERVGKGPVKAKEGADARTRSIDQLIREDKPDLVVIVKGDTMAAYQGDFPMNWARKEVATLTGAVSATGTRCAWVGPPWGQEGGSYGKTYARARAMGQFLAVNVKPCVYIDSQKMSAKGEWPTSDGQHFTVAGYRSWAGAITKALSAQVKK